MCCHDHRDNGHRFDRHHDRQSDDHGCGCPRCRGEGFGFKRRFISNAEVLDMLRSYLKDLENEAQGVREAIAEMEEEERGSAT
jgi:hypothetical protein